jgi:hypothetical protein
MAINMLVDLHASHAPAGSADARVLNSFSAEQRRGRNRMRRNPMKTRMWLPLLAAVASSGLGSTGVIEAQQAGMSFFVSSVGKGNGADLGGLDGTDLG